MTRVRMCHLSCLFLLFSSSEVLHTRYCLTLILLGLTSLCTVLPCDEKTRPQSHDPNALPRHTEIRRYSRRDYDAPRVTSEWMQLVSEASGTAGRGVSSGAGDDGSGNFLGDRRGRDGPAVTTVRVRSDDDNVFASATSRPYPAANYPKPDLDDRLDDDPTEDRRITEANVLGNTKQENGENAELDGAPATPSVAYYSQDGAASEFQFRRNRDGDSGANSALSYGARRSADDLFGISVRGRDASIGAAVDRSNQARLYKSSNADRRILAGSRRDRNAVGLDVATLASPSADDVFVENPLVNCATERASDYSARRSARGNELLAQFGERDIDTAVSYRDDLAGRGSDGGSDSLEAAGQAHLDRRDDHLRDNRNGGARGSESAASDYPGEFDDFDVDDEGSAINDSDSETIMVDVVSNYLDRDVASIENRTAIDSLAGAEIRAAHRDGGGERAELDCDDNRVIRTKRFGVRKGSSDSREYEDVYDYFAEVNEALMTAGNGSDTGADVDYEAPFIGFEGSQKFPVKVNHKLAAVQQVEKFDRRHFGPHKEDVLEETWYPSTAPPDLPKSPSRDVPHRRRKTHDDAASGVGATDGPEDAKIVKRDETRNDSFDNTSPLPGASSGVRAPGSPSAKSSPDEKLATDAPSTADVNLKDTTLDESESAERTEAVTSSSTKSIEKINITILGLFEMTDGTVSRPEGSSELQAAKLAVDRVNELDILKHFRLRLIYNDTKGDPGVATDRFFHALYSTRKKRHLMPFLLGTAYSEVTEALAKIVPYWNVIQVSFGSTAPALSDSNKFPLFLRTVAPDSSHNPARIALIKHFGWDTVTAFSQTGDMYSLAVNDLVTELEQANITCSATITFTENDYKEKLQTLKQLDTRIIVGSFSPRLARHVFCEAWKLEMHGGDYAWILPGDTIDLSGMMSDWWHADDGECSQILDGLIIVKSHATLVRDEAGASGLTSAKFTSELANRGVTHSKFAGQTYDAVWAMALAFARTEVLLNRQNESMTQYTHKRRDFTYRLLEQFKLLHFIGVSGPVSFNDADRVGITAFYQIDEHVIRRIAIYTPEDGKLIMNCSECAETRWPGGQVPVARRVFRLRMVTVEPAAFLTITCIASIGIILALAFLGFNLYFRKHKSIKLSSPRLNNTAAVGCVLVYVAVILLGLDDATLPDSDEYYPAVCTARAYFLSAGFSLAFGSMFTKTYRVHRIFTKSRSGVVKNKLLQDTQLISLICVLLLIDCLVVTLWVTLDPMQHHLHNLTPEISPQDRTVVYQPQVEMCNSEQPNGWLLTLYIYKGLLLVVGVYMAWETRHVKIPALNDSQYIGMSVYLAVVTSGIVVVLANLMLDSVTLAFVTITALILFSTTVTLALLFLPQLTNILAGERLDPVVQSFGLKIECNTRRFVTDDKGELQYRMEVQNRVYRREMAQLELELARLEKQLAQDLGEPSRTSSSASIPQRNPSIGGGLPLLLLSVLPPVIPRASWPSTDPSGIRSGTVAFSSQPDLEPEDPRQNLVDLYKLHCRRETEGPNRLGVFQRLFSLFGSRPSSRKTSTASFTGVASALRAHMGYIAGLMPGARAASTCQVDAQGTHSPHVRCGSGPIISISEEDRRLSLGLRRKERSEPRVNFILPPPNRSRSSSREKIRGSPRFPHRIIPANSLNAIAQSTLVSNPHRWHSLEDATKQKVTKITYNRYSPHNPDVWAICEVGIPFSELANSARNRRSLSPLPLTTTADSESSIDLRKLFRNDSQEAVSPAEYELKTFSNSSSSSSLKVIGATSDFVSSSKNDSISEARCDTSPNSNQDPKPRPLSPVVSVIDTDNRTKEDSDTDVDDHIDTSCV